MYGYYSKYKKRTVFISYYHGDQEAVNKFVRDFGDVFIPKTVGVTDGDFDFDSSDPQYIMRKIRENKLADSTVTIVLVGSCTHSRRYVDWEVKASLQQGSSLPNGLIAINLPYMGNTGALPPRVGKNVIRDENGNDIGYARYMSYPSSKDELRRWIEDAFDARTSRAKLINYKFPNLPDYTFPADWLESFLGRPRGRLGVSSV